MDGLNSPTKGKAPLKQPCGYNTSTNPNRSPVKVNISSYKEKFVSCNDYGLKRPILGTGHWNVKEMEENNPQILLDAHHLLQESQKPFVNLLHVPGVDERGILTRFMYYSYVTCSRSVHHYYPVQREMRRKVLENEALHHAVQRTLCARQQIDASEESQVKLDQYLEKNLHSKAAAILADMMATVTSKALKFCGWLFLTLLRQLTSSVHLHPAQLDALRQLSE
uniref:Uncharacterized protein n=1 Tax=Ciona savignyi TaxID=51511 RepID=H2YW94_CIOSA